MTPHICQYTPAPDQTAPPPSPPPPPPTPRPCYVPKHRVSGRERDGGRLADVGSGVNQLYHFWSSVLVRETRGESERILAPSNHSKFEPQLRCRIACDKQRTKRESAGSAEEDHKKCGSKGRPMIHHRLESMNRIRLHQVWATIPMPECMR